MYERQSKSKFTIHVYAGAYGSNLKTKTIHILLYAL